MTLRNAQTGAIRTGLTDQAGAYTMTALPLTGSYVLSVAKSGFATQELSNIKLRAGETAVFDVTLKPAGQQSEVTVFGTTEGVRSDSAQLGTRLGPATIDETPVLDAR